MISWDRLGGALCAALLAATMVPHAVADEVPAVAAAAPVNPQALTLAREIISIGFPEAERTKLFGGSFDTAFSQFGDLSIPGLNKSPEIKAIVMRHVTGMQGDLRQVVEQHIPAILEAMAVAYAREFTMKELAELRAFVGGPTGHRFFSRSAALMGDPAVAAANRALMQDAMATAMPKRKGLEAEIIGYLTDHPEAAKAITEAN